MRPTTTLRRATLLALAASMALPTVALAWPVSGQDAANSRQASADGPSDPGVRWAVDLDDDTSLQFGTGELDAPILVDGVLVRTADTGPFAGALVGIDAADGELLWTVEDARSSCAPGADAQGNVWVVRTADADDDIDTDFVQALDASTGAPIGGSTFALDDDLPDTTAAGWCNNSSVHIAGSRLILLGGSVNGRNTDNVVALDIAAATPSLAWTIDADDAPYERILVEVSGNLNDVPQARAGAFTASDWLLPVMIDAEPHLARIALASGDLVESSQIPVIDDAGDTVTGTTPWSARTVVTGDRVVVGLRHIFGFGDRNMRTAIHGFTLGDLQLSWTQDYERAQSTAQPGATVLAAGGGLVVHNAGLGALFALDASTGAPAAWSGDIPIREAGASATPNAVLDASGNIYLYNDRDRGTLARVSSSGATNWAFSNATLEFETGIAPGTDTQIAAIGPDGTLYLFNDSRMFAIDGSGGLSDCVLPFTDVAETNTHAVNICRLVEAGITTGRTPTTYAPFGDVTREQMASFLARALGLQGVTSPAQPFPDVAPGNVHAPNINAIREAGITQGRSDGTYDPTGVVTRAEMASFLARAAGLEPVTSGAGFADVSPGNVHTPNIYAVRDAGIAQGRTATSYAPDADVRRDQMASFIIRMVDFLADQD